MTRCVYVTCVVLSLILSIIIVTYVVSLAVLCVLILLFVLIYCHLFVTSQSLQTNGHMPNAVLWLMKTNFVEASLSSYVCVY